MFRRRRFRPVRPLRRFRFRWRRFRPAARATMVRLRAAHASFDQGEFVAAATELGALADEAEASGMPRAPALHIQSGLAWYRAGQAEAGATRIQSGLGLLAEDTESRRLTLMGDRVAADLERWGLPHGAAFVRHELNRLATAATQGSDPSLAGLPAKCPQCGGSVVPGEVEWADARTAVCDYCGSPLTASA